MDAINLVAQIYKRELADANEQRVLFEAQCGLYKQQIEEKDKIIADQNKLIEELKAQLPVISDAD